MNSDDQISVRQYIERVLEEREKTLVLTAKNLEIRLESLNELRALVTHDRAQFLPKSVYDQMHINISERVTRVEHAQSRMIGVALALMAMAGLIGYVLSHITK